MLHHAAGIERIADHDAAGIVGSMIHDGAGVVRSMIHHAPGGLTPDHSSHLFVYKREHGWMGKKRWGT